MPNCVNTVYPKKYAHGFCFAVLCCGYTLTDFPISIRLTSLALWQSNDCPSASKATLMNMDKYFMWIHYERLHNHNKAKHNKTVCIFLGIYCKYVSPSLMPIPFSSHWGLNIITVMLQTPFPNVSSRQYTFVFEFKLHWNLFRYPIDGICLGDGLAPNWRHAITWTDYDHDP